MHRTVQPRAKTRMAKSKVIMKLLIDTQSNRVLFAEAGKDCVDFLFHILSLPIATAIRLVTKPEMPGSVANLYESIENLNESYLQPEQNKDSLLKPKSPARQPTSVVPLLLLNDTPTEKKLNTCPEIYSTANIFGGKHAACPSCGQNISTNTTFMVPPTPPVGQASTECGFVKAVVTYMVMDDLVVKPMSTISSITLLNKFSVKDVNTLMEKEVILGSAEAVKLLKTCLHSKKVLTEVFLNKS